MKSAASTEENRDKIAIRSHVQRPWLCCRGQISAGEMLISL